MESALVRYNGDLLSSQRSEPQQLNAHPSSDQLKAWSNILSGALSGSSSVFPTLSPVQVILCSFVLQLFFTSSSAQQFGKFQPQASRSLFRNCHVGKGHVFLNPNSAGFYRTSSFYTLIFGLKSEL